MVPASLVNQPLLPRVDRLQDGGEEGLVYETRYGTSTPRANFFFGRTFDLVTERESRNPMPPHGGPGGPVGRCMGLYADVLGSNLGVGNFFSKRT